MKQHKSALLSIAGIIILLAGGIWAFSYIQSASALAGDASTSTEAQVKSEDGVSGLTKQTENPLVSPLGSAAGGVVDARSMTVAEVVARLDASVFGSLFTSVNGSAQLSGTGKFTVFVPTDGAFSQLAKGTLSGMSATEKARLVGYHIVKGKALDTDALVSGSVQAASGDLLNFNFGANKIPMIGSAIVITQFNCANGVVYTIDNVLLPPKKLLRSS